MSFVKDAGIVPKGKRYDRSFLVKDANKKYKKTELGDFIYSSNNLETGSIGFNKYGPALISPVYSIFYSENPLISEFIGILSQKSSFINKMIRYRQGVVYGQFKIHEKDFLRIQIYLPKNKELNGLIKFIKIIERLITLYQRKNSKNMALRNYINRRIFRDNKNNIKETTLGNLMSKGGSGGTPRTTIKEYYDGGIPFLSITDISISNGKIESTEKNISKLGLKNSSAYLVPKNAVCLAMYASVGKVGLTNIELSTSQAFYNLEFKSPHLAKYIYYRLRYADENNEWKPYIGVGTQGNLNAATVKNFIIKIPSDQHIKYYVNQLNNLDNLINNTSIIIEKLNKLKSFYLSKIFI